MGKVLTNVKDVNIRGDHSCEMVNYLEIIDDWYDLIACKYILGRDTR